MNYSVRLIDVCLACFFLINLALGLAVVATSALAVRCAESMRAAAGARLLLLLRLAPVTLALLSVAAFCVPSYFRFEHDAEESVGLLCSVLAACGLLTLLVSAARLVWGVVLSGRIIREFTGSARPVFALVGLLRPRVIVSSPVREALSNAQMDAAMRHEAAHSRSRDNVKRLAIFAAPGLLPGSFRTLERHWHRLTEWAADDAAIAGEPGLAIALAEALVCVARLAGQPEGAPLVSSLAAGQDDLSQRVGRLLASQPQSSASVFPGFLPGFLPKSSMLVLPVLGMVAFAIAEQKELLYVVHRAMERLVQ